MMNITRRDMIRFGFSHQTVNQHWNHMRRAQGAALGRYAKLWQLRARMVALGGETYKICGALTSADMCRGFAMGLKYAEENRNVLDDADCIVAGVKDFAKDITEIMN